MPKQEPPKQRHERRVPVSRSIAAPAVRMIVLRGLAWITDDGSERLEFDTEFIPVVGIESCVDDIYVKYCSPGIEPHVPEKEASAEDWTDMGWSHYRATDTRALVVHDNTFMAMDEIHATNTEEMLITCTWPPERDRQELADEIEYLHKLARKGAESLLAGRKPRTVAST